ncbi:hypothetical protein H4582DRAFT_1786911, partial [Lactarius indigo]
DEVRGTCHHPCPCGDSFEISRKQLVNCGESCQTLIVVVYHTLIFKDEPPNDKDAGECEDDGGDSDDDECVLDDAMEKIWL